jgi:hypothetical protein
MFSAADPMKEEYRMFHINIAGRTLAIVLDRGSDNSVWFNSFLTPFDYGNEESFELIPAGSTTYELNQFDWAVIKNQLILTHFSGTFMPVAISFDSSGNVVLNKTTVPMNLNSSALPQVSSNGTSTNFYINTDWYSMGMSDIGANSLPVTIGSWDTTAKTVQITSTDPTVKAILQRSGVLYLEALGRKDFGDGFYRNVVVSDYYTPVSNVTNGVVCTYRMGIDTTRQDPLTYTGVTTTTSWAYSAWYAGNWPRTVTTHEGRLVFGGTASTPLTIFGSKVASPTFFIHLKRPPSGCEFAPMMPPTGDTLPTDPFVFALSAKEDCGINFVQSAGNLVVGTDRREFVVSGGDSIISALSISSRSMTAQGSVPVSSISTGANVFYLSKSGKQLFKFKYNDANGSHVSQEVSLLFNDLLDEDTIKQVAWAPHISSVMILMESGKVYGLVDNDQLDMTAFFDTLVTGVETLSFAPYRSQYGYGNTGDCVMYIGEHGLYRMEQVYFEKDNTGIYSDIADANAFMFIDNAVEMVYEGSTNFSINGDTFNLGTSSGWPIPVRYFSGKTVTVIHMDTNASVTFDVPVYVGVDWALLTDATIPVTGSIMVGEAPRVMAGATMPIEAGQQWGSAQMGIKNIDKLSFRVYKSYSIEVSSGEGSPQVWEEVVFADDTGNCQSVRKEVQFSSSPKYDQIIYFRNTKAEPCTIVGINMRGVSNDG